MHTSKDSAPSPNLQVKSPIFCGGKTHTSSLEIRKWLQIFDIGVKHNGQSDSWMDDFQQRKMGQEDYSFWKKTSFRFLPLASKRVLIKTSQITVSLFTVGVRCSELCNKGGAHQRVSWHGASMCHHFSQWAPAEAQNQVKAAQSAHWEWMVTFQTLCTCLLQKHERIMPSTSSVIFISAPSNPDRCCLSGALPLCV